MLNVMVFAEKKDPAKHDFKPEWIIFWMERMKELHLEEVEKKKKEIRKKCNLPEDAVERTEELREQFAMKVNKTDRPDETSASQRNTKRNENNLSRSRSRDRRNRSGSRERSPNRRAYRRDKDEPDRRNRDRSPVARRGRSRSSRDRSPRDRSPAYERKRSGPPSDRYERERSRPDSRGEYYRDEPPSSMMYSRHMRDPHYDSYHESWPPHYYGVGPHGRAPPPSNYYPPSGERPPVYPPRPREREPKSEERDELDDEPLTVVSVLRLLTALEELLGPSLGPKIIDMLAKALALEKIKPNSADEMLLNEDNCVLFETVKEKLKGQLIAGVLEKNQIKAVKRAVKNIASVIHLVNEANKDKPKPDISATEPVMNKAIEKPDEMECAPTIPMAAAGSASSASGDLIDRAEIAKKITTALIAQGKTDLSQQDLYALVDVYIQKTKDKAKAGQAEQTIAAPPVAVSATPRTVPVEKKQQFANGNDVHDDQPVDAGEFDLSETTSSALESLTDTDLQTLLQNYSDLSKEEQQHLVIYLKRLDAINPQRIESLRKLVNLDEFLPRKVTNAPVMTAITALPATSASGTNTKLSIGLAPRPQPPKLVSEKIFDSDDDDDYSMDDVLKAASKNVKEKEVRDDETRHSNLSNQHGHDDIDHRQYDDEDDDCEIVPNDRSSQDRAKSAVSNLFSDTESLVANLMGSLQKNAKNHLLESHNDSDPFSFLRNANLPLFGNALDRSGDVNNMNQSQSSQMPNSARPQTNLPFYQQQEQSSSNDSMQQSTSSLRSQYQQQPAQFANSNNQWLPNSQQQQQQQQAPPSMPFQSTLNDKPNFSFSFLGRSEAAPNINQSTLSSFLGTGLNTLPNNQQLLQNQPFQMPQLSSLPAALRQQIQQQQQQQQIFSSNNMSAFQGNRQLTQEEIMTQVHKIQQQINSNPNQYQRRF